MMLRKSVAQVQEETRTSELKRSLGPWNLVFLGIGCIIGAGIFVRTGNAAALHAGPAVLISYLIAGTVCAFAGLCYAELASTLPVSGSAYTYSYTTIGEFAAWVMGALLLLEYGLAASVVAVGWSGYMVSLLGDIGLHIPAGADRSDRPPSAEGWRRRARERSAGGLRVQPAGLFGLHGACHPAGDRRFGKREVQQCHRRHQGDRADRLHPRRRVHPAEEFAGLHAQLASLHPEPTGAKGEFGWTGILRAASIVFFAYIGFEAVSTAGQEAKNPGKDMPFGIIGSLLACTVIYILVSIVLTLIVNYKSLNVPDPVAVAVDAFGPQWAWFAKTIKVGAIIGLTSVVLVLMYAQTRIFYTMARDGLLPKIFSTVHQKFRTPWINTIVVGLITACAAGFFDINTLGDMTSVGTLAAFGIVCLTVIWLRRTHPDIPRGYRVPLYPVVPALGIVTCFALIFTVETRVLIFFAWYTGIMIVLYFVYGMHNSVLAKGGHRAEDGEPRTYFPEDEPKDASGKPKIRP